MKTGIKDELTQDELNRRHEQKRKTEEGLICDCQDGLMRLSLLIGAARAVDMVALLDWPQIHQYAGEITLWAGEASGLDAATVKGEAAA